MLLTGYTKELFRPECNPSFLSLNCVAHLDADIGPVIPYLNAELGGTQFTPDPPTVLFKSHGRLIAVYPRKIAVNALDSEAEADRILEWLVREINEIWERRSEIVPCHESARQPKLTEIVRLLPKTNCRECGQPTCLVFATLAAQGVTGAADCPGLSEENREALAAYLEGFAFPDP